ncbi:hypothetical protein PMIN06_000041 [Paraphaeosphaeria minitans]
MQQPGRVVVNKDFETIVPSKAEVVAAHTACRRHGRNVSTMELGCGRNRQNACLRKRHCLEATDPNVESIPETRRNMWWPAHRLVRSGNTIALWRAMEDKTE